MVRLPVIDRALAGALLAVAVQLVSGTFHGARATLQRSALVAGPADPGLAVQGAAADTVVDRWLEALSRGTASITSVGDELRANTELRTRIGPFFGERLAQWTGDDPDRLSAAARVSLSMDGARGARGFADRFLVGHPGRSKTFLMDYLRAADRAEKHREAAWAATQLSLISPRAADRARWQSEAAERMLLAGDSAGARAGLRDLARDPAPGARARESARSRLVEVVAGDAASVDEALEEIAAYAAAYPDSIGRTAGHRAQLALTMAKARGAAAALRWIEGFIGQDTSVVSDVALAGAAAQLAFYSGDREKALEYSVMALAVATDDPADRARRVELLALVQSSDSSGVAWAGTAAHALFADPENAGPVVEFPTGVAGRPSPGVLSFLAARADRASRQDLASELWSRIVDSHPESAEAPAAMLGLARTAAARGDESARTAWLERLVVEYPQSALAPSARRMLAAGGNSPARPGAGER